MPRSKLYWLHRFVYHVQNMSRFERVQRLRGWHYAALLHQAGRNLRVDAGAKFFHPQNISVGDDCFIGAGSRFYAWNEHITIGNQVLVAAEVLMMTRNHGYADADIPIADQGFSNAPISVEDNVWIGFRAIILAGVTIGHGSIVAAGAVVTRDVEPYSVVGGVPARLIRKRTNSGPVDDV